MNRAIKRLAAEYGLDPVAVNEHEKYARTGVKTPQGEAARIALWCAFHGRPPCERCEYNSKLAQLAIDQVERNWITRLWHLFRWYLPQEMAKDTEASSGGWQ